jgi:hypothetical protein
LVSLCFLTAAPVGPAAQPASVPDLSGVWGRDWLFFEPKPGSPFPVGAKMRPDGTVILEEIADDTNPILTQKAAAKIRQVNEIARNDSVPDPANQCRPEPTPFTLTWQTGVTLIQQKNEAILIYLADQKVRHVRMNVPHPAHLIPSWQGDSVGRYDGDTLVIDTIGQRVGPLSTVDLWGTPFSENLHVIERYRLIDGVAAREAQQKHEARYFPAGRPGPHTNEYGRGTLDPDTSRPGLQVEVTVEDPEMFTSAWSGLITYRHVLGDWPEAICAENTREYYANRDTAIPQADKPDF